MKYLVITIVLLSSSLPMASSSIPKPQVKECGGFEWLWDAFYHDRGCTFFN